jgi:hypothetical protein
MSLRIRSISYVLYNIGDLSKHLAVGYPQNRTEKIKTKTNVLSESEYIPRLKKK